MYDVFSSDYDRFVSWPGRLAYEIPFIERQIQDLPRLEGKNVNILDTACGTGMHAIALAQRGYTCAGADLSARMVGRARANAAAARVTMPFVAAGFGALQEAFAGQRFDVLLCLGNSLPHLLSPADLAQALADFAACLRPGGLLLIQNRNFDAVMLKKARWMDPQPAQEGDKEWLFFRFYDFDPDGLIAFNIATLHREGGGSWQQHIATTRLRPLLRTELVAALETAGFDQIACFGSMEDVPFDSAGSGNLVLTARNANKI
jgi:glycine/sarcosine N-methyltransferase